MEDKNLIERNKIGFFSKIKNWFWNLIGVKNTNDTKQDDELELEKQQNVQSDEVFEEYEGIQDKLKYQFSTPTVSKQKIDKIKLELDSGKIGIEKLYQLSSDEIEELEKVYDTQIDDTVSKLNEIEVSLNSYRRRLSKIQNQ